MTANILGKVFLVGAGPGDPGLLTLKGKRYLEAADVIFYDQLVNGELLEFAHADAELIDVGKRHDQIAISVHGEVGRTVDRDP